MTAQDREATPENLAEIFRSGRPTTGYFSMGGSPLQLERLATLGYDYLVIDGQHGYFSESDWAHAVRAVEVAGSPAIIRVPEAGIGVIGRALDTGAAGVIVPLVNSAAEARAAVAAAKFPPTGVRSRGVARTSPYLVGSLHEIDQKTVVLCMIETRAGLEDVEAIAAVEHLDGLYIGPNDLSIALGGSGVGDPAVADEFREAIARILTAAGSAGKFVVFHTPSGEAAAERRAAGFSHVTVANDVNHVCQAAAEHLARANAQG